MLGAGAAAVAVGAGAACAPRNWGAHPDAALLLDSEQKPDAALLALAAEIREAERAYRDACEAFCAAESADDDEATRIAEQREEATAARLQDVIARMAGTPAETSTGIVVKAARIAWSLRPEAGSAILAAEEPLAASLLADIARLAPAASAVPPS